MKFLLPMIVCLPLAAQWIGYPTPGLPRNADGSPNLSAPPPKFVDGKPDLTGLWRVNSRGYDLNAASDLAADQIAPWARDVYRQRVDNYGRDGRADTLCLPHGPAAILHWNGPAKFLQAPGALAILLPDLSYRQILMDGRPQAKIEYPTWMGYSVGHWEGDTLVVETTGYTEQIWLDLGGHPHTEELRITERFTRLSWGRMDLEVTYSDPKIYAKNWTIRVDMNLVSDDELIEANCRENEKDVSHFVGKESDGAVQVPAETLARYVGVFSEVQGSGLPTRRVEFSLDGGELWATMEGGARRLLVPTSQTTIGQFEFVVGRDGTVNEYSVQGFGRIDRGLRIAK